MVAADGLVLAAGAGRRMGGPKALIRAADGVPWLVRTVGYLREGGCRHVTVVLGAGAGQAQRLLVDGLPEERAGAVTVVRLVEGQPLSASLGAGLKRSDPTADLLVVTLVDLPDVDARVVRRLLAAAGDQVNSSHPARAGLLRAYYHGRPGHPVLLGRDHWAPIRAVTDGDRGARDYLATTPHVAVECGDLASGRDVDRPSDLFDPSGPFDRAGRSEGDPTNAQPGPD